MISDAMTLSNVEGDGRNRKGRIARPFLNDLQLQLLTYECASESAG
jgi:hypothetical protein